MAGGRSLGFESPLNDLEVADGGRAPEIKLVFAAAEESGSSTLAAARMRLAVFDWDAIAKLLSAR
jgi:hypothetical protein